MRVYEAKMVYTLVAPGELVCLNSPADIVSYLASAFAEYPLQESAYAVFVNRRNRPLGRHRISLGTLVSTLMSPREVFRGAILAGASAIILAHNHPSGDPLPSPADIRVTRSLREAGELLEIPVIDHVIVGTPEEDPTGTGYYSFREAGLL